MAHTAALAMQSATGAAESKAASAAALSADHAAEVAARDAERRQRLVAVARHERDLLELRSMPLKEYLVDTVVPTLTQGLAEVCQLQPADPISHLAQYLYAASQEEEEKESAM
jgi:adenylate kinase